MKIKNELLNILDICRVEGNILYLPNITLDRKTYQEVNKCIESIGGKWNKKLKGHLFDEDPSELVETLILTGEFTDIKKEYQYFPTPLELAKKMIELAEITESDTLMEPSAGQGAIADLFPKENSIMLVELNEANAKVLNSKGYDVYIGDFLDLKEITATKIIMNPPFTKQQDVDHVLHAFDILQNEGILISVVSESAFFRENSKSVDFREFISKNYAEVIDLPEGTFKESGTMVKTKLIKIKKVI